MNQEPVGFNSASALTSFTATKAAPKKAKAYSAASQTLSARANNAATKSKTRIQILCLEANYHPLIEPVSLISCLYPPKTKVLLI